MHANIVTCVVLLELIQCQADTRLKSETPDDKQQILLMNTSMHTKALIIILTYPVH